MYSTYLEKNSENLLRTGRPVVLEFKLFPKKQAKGAYYCTVLHSGIDFSYFLADFPCGT